MVVRAPKGTTEAMYFPAGSTNLLQAMIGTPSANWPDIQDALDFNGQFGLFVSAPPGTSETYTSYYGGSYITSKGIFPFYQVADKTSPNYLITQAAGAEDGGYLHSDLYPADNNSTIQVGLLDAAIPASVNELSITGINSKILASATGLVFKYWGNPAYALNPMAASYTLTLSGTKVMVDAPDGTGPVQVGTLNGSTLTLTGTLGASSFLYFNFANLLSDTAYKDITGDWYLDAANPTHNKNTYQAALLILLTGAAKWILDVQDDTYAYIVQKSPTEKTTILTITNIEYDKWSHSLALNAYKNEMVLTGRPSPYPTAADCGNASGLYAVFNDSSANGTTGIYQSNGNSIAPKNVTANYKTKYVRIKGAGTLRDTQGAVITQNGVNPETALIASYVDAIYYIDSLGVMNLAYNGAISPKVNSAYNTISFTTQEVVFAGQLTTGGSYTGSLDENGLDSYGKNIYYPNVLPDDMKTFVEIHVVRPFDSEINGAGFYTGYRILDNKAASASMTVNLSGQRYMTKVVAGLVASGTTGGAPVADFTPALNAGWAEAGGSVYDGVGVFMELTGIESLKEMIYNLRSSKRTLSTFVSPRLITASEFADVNTIAVSGRITGTAQYVNQFLRMDSNRKKYWTSLMGAIGAKLATIMEKRMGGWAPMYTDDGGLGGQLNVAVVKAMYDFDKDQEEILDKLGLNPIRFDAQYGVMIVGQKTTADPENVSDWSYLGHTMAFDAFKREIRDNVMTPQIGKPNDTYYQNLRQRQAEAILSRRIGGSRPIWAKGAIEVAGVNTPEIKAQRGFVIQATVKVNVFSEWVLLTLINEAQT